MEQSILPTWPLSGNDFLLFGLILIIGLIGGEIAHRSQYLPRITGFVISGFLLGPGVTGLVNAHMLGQAQSFTQIALALILFQLGMQLDITRLRQQKFHLLAGISESVLSFIAIFLVLIWVGISHFHAAIVAAIGMSSSPAVVLLVAREFNAKGPVTDTALSHVAMNNVFSYATFTLLLPFLHYSETSQWSVIMIKPFYQSGVSLILAFLLAKTCFFIAKRLGNNDSLQFALIVSIIMVALGLSSLFNGSALLTLLVTGILVRNLDKGQNLKIVKFGHAGDIFFILLFVVAGASLHVHALMTSGLVALSFVATRLIAKILGLLALKPFSPLSVKQTTLMGLTLTPMAGMAIGLTNSLNNVYPEFSQELAAIILGAVAILESIGPVLTEFALKKAGEIDADTQVNH